MSSDTEITGTSIERATRSAVRCRVPVSDVGHVGVGHQVDVGPGDAAGVGGQDDGAVHLRQLGQALRAVGGVEQEAARADVQHLGPVADDDERAHAGLEDAVEALAERRAGRHGGERVEEADAAWRAGMAECVLAAHSPTRAPAAIGRRVGRPAAACMPAGPSGADARHDRPAEAQPGRLGEPPGEVAHLAHLAAEADLAADDEVVGQGRPARDETSGQGEGQVGRRLEHPHATGGQGEHVGSPRSLTPSRWSSTATTVARRRPSMPWADRRGLACSPASTSACTSTSSGRLPSMAGTTTEPGHAGPAVGEEQRAGVGHADEPAVGQLEQAELAGRAEAVLDGPQQPEGVVAVALEGEHGVDDVLEHPGPGQVAVLGDVADEDDGHRPLLRLAGPAGGRTPAPGRPSPGAPGSSGS